MPKDEELLAAPPAGGSAGPSRSRYLPRGVTNPFARVPKKLPKVYFNDGETIYASWVDPELSTPTGRKRFIAAIKAAMRSFARSQARKGPARGPDGPRASNPRKGS